MCRFTASRTAGLLAGIYLLQKFFWIPAFHQKMKHGGQDDLGYKRARNKYADVIRQMMKHGGQDDVGYSTTSATVVQELND